MSYYLPFNNATISTTHLIMPEPQQQCYPMCSSTVQTVLGLMPSINHMSQWWHHWSTTESGQYCTSGTDHDKSGHYKAADHCPQRF